GWFTAHVAKALSLRRRAYATLQSVQHLTLDKVALAHKAYKRAVSLCKQVIRQAKQAHLTRQIEHSHANPSGVWERLNRPLRPPAHYFEHNGQVYAGDMRPYAIADLMTTV